MAFRYRALIGFVTGVLIGYATGGTWGAIIVGAAGVGGAYVFNPQKSDSD